MDYKIYNCNATDLEEYVERGSVDLIVTSPPYDTLRSYGGIGDGWNELTFKEIACNLSLILKEGGVLVWVVNDKTEGGSETGSAFKQALYFKELGLKLNDTMIWCLSGGSKLYVKTQNGVSVSYIKDIVRLDPSTVELWDGNKWVKVAAFRENVMAKKKIRIQLRSGENIYCTKEHRWVLQNGDEVLTSELKPGDVLKTCTLPDCGEHNPLILTKDVLWLLGLYLAEGSHSEDTIQISLCSDEIGWIDRIESAVKSLGGTITHSVKGNTLNVRCYSKVFNAVLSQYLSGKTAKDKHLASICWTLSNDNLTEIVKGYLDGDGHYDEKNDRWRLGFTENQYLENDLRTLAARLGAKITLLRKGARIKGILKEYPSLTGEWKWRQSSHHNEKSRSEILSITEEQMRPDEHMWDIEVDSDEHLFSLASGVLTHNCKTNPMPQVKQPRYSQDFEYMFVFSKGKPKTFNPIMVPCKCAGQNYDSTCKNMGGENGRTEKHFTINKEKVDSNVWDIAIAQNKTDHPAVFPIEIPLRHIKTWSNEGDVVLDPFMGSGTTGLAALELGRKFIGIDLNKDYCRMAEKRIKEYEEKTLHADKGANIR